MDDDPKRKLPPAILRLVGSLRAMIGAVGAGADFLLFVGVLDHESTAILLDQLRSLGSSVDERSSGAELIRSVVRQLVPLANRVQKELMSIQGDPVASYYLRQIREATKLLKGEGF